MRTLGIDIGGTNIRSALWNGRRLFGKRTTRTPRSKQAFAKYLSLLLSQKSLSGVGIGVAGVVAGTRVVRAPNIPYLKKFDFSSLLTQNLPLKVDNDARCFLRGAYPKHAKRVLVITLGTGIGRALGKNKKVLALKKLEYPETWERQYQKIRDDKSDRALAEFLAPRIAKIAARENPEIILFAGSIAKRAATMRILERKLGRQTKVLRQNAYAGALGAALLKKKAR